MENQKSAIQAQIDKMTGGRDTLAQNRESLTDEITAIKLQIIENQKDADSLIASANDIENSILNRATRLNEIDAEIAAINYKIIQLNADISSHNDEIDNIKQKIADYNKDIENLMLERNNVEKSGVELRASERERTLEREKIGGELARLTERKDVMMREYDDVIRQLYDEYQLTKSDAEKIAIEIEKPADAKKQLAETKSKIRALGNVNVSAIEEYKEVKERYDFMNEQMQDIEKARTELRKLINQLTSQMQEMFVEGFAKINENFTKTFKELLKGVMEVNYSQNSFTEFSKKFNNIISSSSLDELTKLKELYNYSVEVNNTLGQLSLEINSGVCMENFASSSEGNYAKAKEIYAAAVDSYFNRNK